MKLLTLFLLAFLTLAAQTKRPAKSKSAPKPAAAMVLPKDAVEVEPGSWRHTDTQGRKWIYRRTPFGFTRLEDKPEAAKGPASNPADFITATEDGEFIKFERPGPFGPYQWRKNKSELDEVEKTAWERARAKAKQE